MKTLNILPLRIKMTWLPTKVEKAAQALQGYGVGVPAMYCSRVEYVDQNLGHLGYSMVPRKVAFENAMVENIATGSTIMLNRRARDLICRAAAAGGRPS